MAATSMKNAGLEVGAKVTYGEVKAGTVVGILNDPSKINHMVTVAWDDDPQGELSHLMANGLLRDHGDAQKVRSRRFDTLLQNFPGDVGVPEMNDTLERYVVVQRGEENGYHAFEWGDTIEEALRHGARGTDDGWMPEAMYDLDTGNIIRVETVTRLDMVAPEDAPAMANVLEPEPRADFINDVLVSAVEGGLGNWAQVTHYQVVDTPDTHDPDERPEPITRVIVLGEGFTTRQDPLVAFEEVNEVDGTVEGEHIVDTEVIERGIKLALAPGNPAGLVPSLITAIETADADNDAGYIDAGAADAIVQLAIFDGKLVYG